MNIFRRLLQETLGKRVALGLAVGTGFAGGIVTVLMARGLSHAINQVFIEGMGVRDVAGLLLALMGLALLRAALIWGSEASAHTLAARVKHDLRMRLFQHILDLGPAYLQGALYEPTAQGEENDKQVHTGKLVNIATEGIEALEAYFSQYLPQLMLAALIPVTLLVFIFPLDPLSAVVLLLTAPLIPIFMILIGSAAEVQTKRQWRSLSRMSAYFLDVLQGLTTLKLLGRSREQIGVIAQVSERYRQTTMSVLRVTFLSALALELVATLSTAVVAVEIGLRLLYGKLAFEQAFFVLLLAPEFYLPLRLLGTRFHAGIAGREAGKRIFEILDISSNGAGFNLKSSNISHPPSSIEDKPSVTNQPPAITFNNVNYTYPDGRQGVQGISFEVVARKTTVLTGSSGAGKSTLFSLLLGFIHPQQGDILVDGISLSKLCIEEWREKLAWVPQNPYLFNDSVATNIRLARPEASLTEIRQAARLAQADEFIQALPQGYNTVIGERGTRLSAGQAQRIALARAFLKDAPVLLLDEPTAHLDADSEARLEEATRRLMAGRTVLIIAHHPKTLAEANQIVVIETGESGTEHAATREHSKEASGQLQNSREQPAVDQIVPTIRHEPTAIEYTPSSTSHTSRTAFRLLKLLAPFGGRVALSVLLGFITIGSSVGLMATSAYLISQAALHPSIAELQVAIVGVRFFGLVRGVFRYLERLVTHDVTFRLLGRWRAWFYQALEPLAPARLMAYHSGDLLNRVIADVNTLENFYVRGIAPPLVALLTTLVMGFFMFRFGNTLAVIFLLFMLLAGAALPWLVRFLSRHTGRQVIQSRAELSARLVDGIQGMADLLALDAGDRQVKDVEELSHNLERAQTRLAGLSSLQLAIARLLADLGMLGVLALAIQQVAQGRLNGVLLGVLALAALTSFEALQPLPQAAQTLESSLTAANRLFEIVDASPAVQDTAAPLPVPQDFSLCVDGLNFSYPTDLSKDYLLENISFNLSPGKRIAIVGPSGTGKTTLLHLLVRFWEYPEGSIRLGGTELRQMQAEEVRKRIAVVPQNPYLFSATMGENLLIARPSATQEEIIHATKVAQIHDFIQSLPEGYETWAGESGLRLSGGQRQRIAIARALLQDAPLLMLDEPTANLDPANEEAVIQALLHQARDRSLMMVTHRLVGMEAMDEILVMDNGRIIERGKHEALLALNGLYRRVWDLQHSSAT